MSNTATEDPTRPAIGIFWMVISGLLFVGFTAIVKSMSGRLPAAETAWIRYVLGLVFFLPFLGRLLKVRLDRATLGLLVLRGFIHAIAVVTWFYAMTRITLAEVTAINYLNPIFVTLGAAFFLGEKLAIRRVGAIVIALIGALIILRPGLREIEPGHYAMVCTAILFAVAYLILGPISKRVDAFVIVAMLSITVAIALTPIALTNWVTPTWREIGLLFIVAGLATAGHYTMTLAFAAAPLTVTQPVTFLQLVWSVTLGAVVFGEGIDPWVLVGGGIIISAVTFITFREAMLKRRITPGTNQAKF
ncbi:MAG: DMT family transporter [Pseudomonadota bacterium]|nr:DMT family transporter [Pseudomonadota bacterium]